MLSESQAAARSTDGNASVFWLLNGSPDSWMTNPSITCVSTWRKWNILKNNMIMNFVEYIKKNIITCIEKINTNQIHGYHFKQDKD